MMSYETRNACRSWEDSSPRESSYDTDNYFFCDSCETVCSVDRNYNELNGKDYCNDCFEDMDEDDEDQDNE